MDEQPFALPTTDGDDFWNTAWYLYTAKTEFLLRLAEKLKFDDSYACHPVRIRPGQVTQD